MAHAATYFPRSNVLTRVRDGDRSGKAWLCKAIFPTKLGLRSSQDGRTDGRTYRPSTVTLAAHARRGLMRAFEIKSHNFPDRINNRRLYDMTCVGVPFSKLCEHVCFSCWYEGLSNYGDVVVKFITTCSPAEPSFKGSC